MPGKPVLILRQPGEVIMRRCKDREEALAELKDLPRGPHFDYEIRER
jgi:hypothetical protein